EGEPVILNIDGHGIRITPLNASNQFFDLAGDGYQHRTAWAAPGNGVLVLDLGGGSSVISKRSVEFTSWDPTAQTDMQALADVFDPNHNGKLDSGDAHWADFKVLVTNQDGTTTLKTLAELGIQSIDLTSDNKTTVLADGSVITGQTTFTRTDGTTGAVADASLALDAQGYAVQQTVTHNADGSTTIDSRALNGDGSLANETIETTSADGLSVTVSFDDDGDGVVDRVQTDVTIVNADGSRTETLSDRNGAGRLTDRTVTTTSPDGK